MKTMFNALQDYFENIVKPTVDEYLSGTGRFSIRRAKLAAIVLEHMIDYYDMEYSDSHATSSDRDRKNKIRRKIEEQCPSYSIVRSVADATKHKSLSRTDKNIKDVKQITCPPGLFQAPFSQGYFAEAIEVCIVSDSGKMASIEKPITELLKFWEENYKNPSFFKVDSTSIQQ